MDFNSSFMELPKSSSALSSEMQRPIHMDSSMPSDKKIQQDEDERDPSFMQLLKENLFSFWKRQKEEILRSDPKRKHDLPISRIRRAMKSNDQVKMVSAHSTVLLSKAIEMFSMELTLRAWMQADQGKCRTLKRYDFARAIMDEELFDFLSDIVPLQTSKVQKEANDGQGNDSNPAYQVVQSNNISCQYQVQEANDGQGNESHPAYQVLQPNNIPAEANDGQGNEFHPTYQMGQPNNIPASFISAQGIPAPFMLPPLINLSPEPEFDIDEYLVDIEEGL
ncbi:nuclear transcription factor Y subunit C-4-like isoform X2 [Solanum verrucosum]|uniref:nuclear transcription factor Y subunit C-4-like isoform X2 n=1 Tax=Solanum verrucosum TaxID=315347 RepID=UPI0020D150E4|nr:nuclear transcription factor Y subunit C-4-like isoform X2 [Solanum verrucosum]